MGSMVFGQTAAVMCPSLQDHPGSRGQAGNRLPEYQFPGQKKCRRPSDLNFSPSENSKKIIYFPENKDKEELTHFSFQSQ